MPILSAQAEVRHGEQPPVARKRHINWALKAVLPIAAVLLNGLLLFVLVSLSLAEGERHVVITVAAAGAFLICVAVIMVLAVSVRRPMLELQDKIARVRLGDMDASVSFAARNDEIGDLGRDFNEMVAQLKASREEIQRLHQTQMSRAEHFATLGELAAGLAHEIRNPLAGIAGVIEIVGRDLPPNSPARSVIKDAKEEAVQINRILTDLLETARPKPPQFRVSDMCSTAEHAVMFARQQAITKRIMIELEIKRRDSAGRTRSQPDQPGAAEPAAQRHSVHGQAGRHPRLAWRATRTTCSSPSPTKARASRRNTCPTSSARSSPPRDTARAWDFAGPPHRGSARRPHRRHQRSRQRAPNSKSGCPLRVPTPAARRPGSAQDSEVRILKALGMSTRHHPFIAAAEG